ncbi:MAG: T9SS type A sorting domain-containing protein [Bacteroidia bacterium]|nr:T9SS type A sorting domain-containing protein [Bacteroidia bacterium]
MKKVLLLLVLCISIQLQAQVYTSPVMTFPLKAVYNMGPGSDPWLPVLKHQQLPKPHPGADRALVRQVKASLDAQYRSRRQAAPASAQKTAANAPVLLDNFIGNGFNLYVPNDNDVAISNGGFVASVNNTMLYGKNTATNQVFGSVTLHSLVASLGLTMEEFDPKILYDPDSDRFIIAFLNGFNDTTSNIILGFSQGNSSSGLWNFYTLPGDPFNNGLWTDFPMFSVSDKELFITLNLLYNDSTWQTGFNQTIIWQVNKENGYLGQPLNTQLHGNMQYNGSQLRNLCPVKGGPGTYGPGAYFLSNRNFSAGNDTLFLVHVSDTIGSATQQVSIQALVSPLQYRMPVDADQLGTVERLIVNDARVMGAYLHDDQIQFVMTVLDTLSGYDGIYHGFVHQVSTAPNVSAFIYTVPNTDIAYPNIAWAGAGPGDHKSVFGFLYASPSQFPGTAAAAFDGTSYSTRTIVKVGASFCNMLIGDERWGDYTGCQTRYNEPGYVWVNGSYTIFNGVTRTWIGELTVTTAQALGETGRENQTLLYPNPAEDMTSIRFEVPLPGRITIRIYDNKGALVHQLFHGSLSAGSNEIRFRTEALSAGLYQVVVADAEGKEMAREKLLVE